MFENDKVYIFQILGNIMGFRGLEHTGSIEGKTRLPEGYNVKNLEEDMKKVGIEIEDSKRSGLFMRRKILIGYPDGESYRFILEVSGRDVRFEFYSDTKDHGELSKNKLLSLLYSLSYRADRTLPCGT